MMERAPRVRIAQWLLSGLALVTVAIAAQPDPFASNNTLYPDPKDWKHGFRPSNYDYPTTSDARWLDAALPRTPLTQRTAPAYVAAVKRFIGPALSGLVNDPLNWTPQKAGWYDMPWGGQGNPGPDGSIDPTSGREALLGSYTGQMLQPGAYPSDPPKVPFQNHAVVYYNDVAASQLGKVWHDPFHPKIAEAQFPEGSMVVKVEAATLTEEQWPVLANSSVSYIFRPAVADLLKGKNPATLTPVVTPMRFLQMAVRVKDSKVAPQTGWVFIAFAYDTRSNGITVWDRTVPIGAMWGNDPKFATDPDGGKGKLQETWVSPTLPPFIKDGLGWGDRLAGPLDLGVRHNAVTVTGKRFGEGNQGMRASSCVSCHSAAQYPFVANLYPSPNMSFPREGQQFLMYDEGSAAWARWFQNRRGDKALSGAHHRGIVGTDYDMMLTFALMRANGSADTDAFIRHPLAGH